MGPCVSTTASRDVPELFDEPSAGREQEEAPLHQSLAARLRAVGDLVIRRAPHPTAILVLPGYGTDDRATLPMRWYLSRLGHRVVGWELGVHRPPVEPMVRAFIPKLESLADASNEPVTVVGWSLGGIVAREAARARPELIAHVITLGSPLQYSPQRGRIDPIRVPVTSIYSKRDRVVNWKYSIDRTTPGAVNIEVRSSHAGLGLDPAVWRVVAESIDRRRAADLDQHVGGHGRASEPGGIAREPAWPATGRVGP
jgi:pimeloyl-ACP methyl ester carboxylesterase